MEVFVFLAIIFAAYLWFRTYRALFTIRQFHPNHSHRTLFAGLPFLCMVFIGVVLSFWSSPSVRSESGWMALSMVAGAAWLQLALFLLSLLGIGAREDVIERQNAAAAWVVSGTLIGTTLCYAGSNIGKGPGPEAVLFCAVLSTSVLFGFWFLLERIYWLSDRITIEKDESAGIRAGGWMLSLGLIFGGAVAGDWASIEDAIRDFFRYAWVALALLLLAIAIERTFKSRQLPRSLHRGASIAVGLAYFLVAAIYVARRGIH